MHIKFFTPFLLILALLAGCAPSRVVTYGFLSGSDYEFYPPTKPLDLKEKHFNFVFHDVRSKTQVAECAAVKPERDSELEGDPGFQFFSSYLKALADSCHGRVDSLASDTVHVDLQVLGPKLKGFISVTVHGIVQFTVRSGDTQKVYCSDMKDGDPDSPYDTDSFATRKSAMRGMIAASCRRAMQQYFEDVSGH